MIDYSKIDQKATVSQAWIEGGEVHACGRSRGSNPYELNSKAYQDWDDGFMDAVYAKEYMEDINGQRTS